MEISKLQNKILQLFMWGFPQVFGIVLLKVDSFAQKFIIKNPILIRISSKFLHNISTCIYIKKCNKNGEF